MSHYRYISAPICTVCIDRHQCNKQEIVDEISDPHNHEQQRSELQEIKRDRIRLKEEYQRMGYTPIETKQAKVWPDLQVGDRVRVTFCDNPPVFEGVLTEYNPPVAEIAMGGATAGGTIQEIEKT